MTPEIGCNTPEWRDRLQTALTNLTNEEELAGNYDHELSPYVAAALHELREVVIPVGPSYIYRATGTRIVDGDTLVCDVDLGFRVTYACMVRLYGVNTPEKGQPGAFAAGVFLKKLTLGKRLLLQSHHDIQSFARWVCTVYSLEVGLEPTNISQALIDAGHGVPFMVDS